MSERSDVAFGFTVGPVMPAAREGAAGDRERYREMLEDCRYGQSLGFGSVWVLEHHFTDYYPSPSPLLFLSHVAAACPGLGLGTAVIVLPWYEPVRFAEEVAMLSLMTDAELHLGLGRGVARIEYDARAIDMAHSRDLFREHYEIAEGLLSGKPFRYRGTHATIPREVTLRPGPVRERIHLYGACNNPGTAERMAEMGLGLLCTSASPFQQNADAIRRVEGDHGVQRRARRRQHPALDPLLHRRQRGTRQGRSDHLSRRLLPRGGGALRDPRQPVEGRAHLRAQRPADGTDGGDGRSRPICRPSSNTSLSAGPSKWRPRCGAIGRSASPSSPSTRRSPAAPPKAAAAPWNASPAR